MKTIAVHVIPSAAERTAAHASYGLRFFCALFLLCLLLMSGVPGASAAEEGDGPLVDTTKPLTLDDCIRTALTSSPYMKVEGLSIDMKRIDAENEWYHMFPSVNLNLSSNVPVGGKNDKKSSYTITLTSGEYDPISAYFEHDAQLEMVALAKLEKLKTATELIESIAMVFTLKDSLGDILDAYERLESMARENLSYVTKAFPNTPTVPLEVRLAEHKIRQIKVEKAKISREFANHLIRLKRLLGIPAEMKVDLDTAGVEQEIFQGFNPSGVPYSLVKNNSIYEKMNRSRQKLAGYGVYAAWADYVPKFNFSVRTPDPINNDSSSDDSYYLTFSASVPLVRWGELGRNVDKAELKEKWARQTGRVEDLKQEDAWYQARSKVEELKGDMDIAEAECDMRKMSVRRAEILFNAGNMTYQDLLNEEMARVRTEIQLAVANQLYTTEKLHAFAVSGALLDRFIQVEESDATVN